jgi:hypothetical protein
MIFGFSATLPAGRIEDVADFPRRLGVPLLFDVSVMESASR